MLSNTFGPDSLDQISDPLAESYFETCGKVYASRVCNVSSGKKISFDAVTPLEKDVYQELLTNHLHHATAMNEGVSVAAMIYSIDDNFYIEYGECSDSSSQSKHCAEAKILSLVLSKLSMDEYSKINILSICILSARKKDEDSNDVTPGTPSPLCVDCQTQLKEFLANETNTCTRILSASFNINEETGHKEVSDVHIFYPRDYFPFDTHLKKNEILTSATAITSEMDDKPLEECAERVISQKQAENFLEEIQHSMIGQVVKAVHLIYQDLEEAAFPEPEDYPTVSLDKILNDLRLKKSDFDIETLSVILGAQITLQKEDSPLKQKKINILSNNFTGIPLKAWTEELRGTSALQNALHQSGLHYSFILTACFYSREFKVPNPRDLQNILDRAPVFGDYPLIIIFGDFEKPSFFITTMRKCLPVGRFMGGRANFFHHLYSKVSLDGLTPRAF